MCSPDTWIHHPCLKTELNSMRGSPIKRTTNQFKVSNKEFSQQNSRNLKNRTCLPTGRPTVRIPRHRSSKIIGIIQDRVKSLGKGPIPTERAKSMDRDLTTHISKVEAEACLELNCNRLTLSSTSTSNSNTIVNPLIASLRS